MFTFTNINKFFFISSQIIDITFPHKYIQKLLLPDLSDFSKRNIHIAPIAFNNTKTKEQKHLRLIISKIIFYFPNYPNCKNMAIENVALLDR